MFVIGCGGVLYKEILGRDYAETQIIYNFIHIGDNEALVYK